MATQRAKLVLLGAIDFEVKKLVEHMANPVTRKINEMLVVTEGQLEGHDVAVAASNVGTVFASSAASILIHDYKDGQHVGDILVVRRVVNYDVDVTSFRLPWDPDYRHQRGELPFVNWRHFDAHPDLLRLALASPAPTPPASRVSGTLATGSEFLTAKRKRELQEVWEMVGGADAAEMECAAVAQVCKAFGVPFLAVQSISDTVDGDASDDFNAFCKAAADNVWPIIRHVLNNYSGFAEQG